MYPWESASEIQFIKEQGKELSTHNCISRYPISHGQDKIGHLCKHERMVGCASAPVVLRRLVSASLSVLVLCLLHAFTDPKLVVLCAVAVSVFSLQSCSIWTGTECTALESMFLYTCTRAVGCVQPGRTGLTGPQAEHTLTPRRLARSSHGLQQRM